MSSYRRRTTVQMRQLKAHRTATVTDVVLDRNSLPHPTKPSSDTDSSSSSEFDLDSEPDADLDSESDTSAELIAKEESDIGLYVEPGAESGSKAKAMLKAIARHRKDGPSRPKHTAQTTRLWKRESTFWIQYCQELQEETGLSPEEQLLECDPAVFKAYLEWRLENARINTESTIYAYWKRISEYYNDVTDYAMHNDVLKDVLNWIHRLGLDRSEKEKGAMYVQDLYAILHALWVDDTKPLHGFIRIQISALLLLSAATATRPGALVESASNKGSNKALWFKDVELMKVRNIENPKLSTIVANVNLENVKNKDKGGTPKKFTFRLEILPAFCIVSHILGIGKGQNAFKDGFTDIQQIFNLVIPAERNVLRIKWKKEVLDQPFFCDVIHTTEGARTKSGKAFPYWKYQDTFTRLGRVAGFEKALELYQIRRASGGNINSALDSVERNQVMGHLGSTYEKYYTPTHIPRDFQAIYFGTPSQEELIRSVANMGLSRDRRAPTELNEDEQREVTNHPELVLLRQKRNLLKQKLYNSGFFPLSAAKGTPLHQKYEKAKREISSTYQTLHKERLHETIRAFHESIDTIEITRQLEGKAANEILTLPTVEFELRERAAIAGMLFKPFFNERARVKYIHTFARLCQLQETRRPKALKRKKLDFVVSGARSYKASSLRKRNKTNNGFKKSPTSVVLDQDSEASEDEECAKTLQDLYPIVLPHPVCLICIGNDSFTHERRMRHIPRKDVLKKHVESHFRLPDYQKEFQCRHPKCSDRLLGMMHFKRHALEVHKVTH